MLHDSSHVFYIGFLLMVLGSYKLVVNLAQRMKDVDDRSIAYAEMIMYMYVTKERKFHVKVMDVDSYISIHSRSLLYLGPVRFFQVSKCLLLEARGMMRSEAMPKRGRLMVSRSESPKMENKHVPKVLSSPIMVIIHPSIRSSLSFPVNSSYIILILQHVEWWCIISQTPNKKGVHR